MQISSWSRQSLGGDDYVGRKRNRRRRPSGKSEDESSRQSASAGVGLKGLGRRRAADQALDLAVNTSRDVERQVKVCVRKRKSAMTWRGEQDLQAFFVRRTVIWHCISEHAKP